MRYSSSLLKGNKLLDWKSMPKDPVVETMGKLFSRKNNCCLFRSKINIEKDPEKLAFLRKQCLVAFEEVRGNIESRNKFVFNEVSQILFERWVNNLEIDNIAELMRGIKSFNPTVICVEISFQYCNLLTDNQEDPSYQRDESWGIGLNVSLSATTEDPFGQMNAAIPIERIKYELTEIVSR